MSISKAQYYEEYAITYAPLDVVGRSVVDIGADRGSSVDWFLEHGAASVTAFEADPALWAEMKIHFAGDARVTVYGRWYGQQVYGDVLKCDIEGGESMLTTAYIARFEQFAVALHPLWISPDKYFELRSYMESVGARLVYDVEKEHMFVRSLTA